MRISEELLECKSSGSESRKPRLMVMGIHCDSVPCSINCGNTGVKERLILKGTLKELAVSAKCTDWIQLAHDYPVHMIMNLWLSQKVGNFLTNN
jgi:hypothetical protein